MPGRTVPLTRMRRAIARNMSESARVPQFTVEMNANLSSASEFRSSRQAGDPPISVSDVLVAATALALTRHRRLNASFQDTEIREHSSVNIGWAVALDDGLIAPAIIGADAMPLSTIAAERSRLVVAAQEGTLTAEEAYSATFTISNLGSLGVRRFTALVVPPQAAILAVGAADEHELVALSLSCDHRVVDGAPAARFLGDLVELLEHPDRIVAAHGSGS